MASQSAVVRAQHSVLSWEDIFGRGTSVCQGQETRENADPRPEPRGGHRPGAPNDSPVRLRFRLYLEADGCQ